MLEPFSTNFKYGRQLTVNASGKIDYYLERTRVDLNKVIEYYRYRKYNISNNHILVQILKMMNVDTELTFIDLLEVLDYRAKYIAKHFRIANAITKANYKDKDVYVYKDRGNYFNIDNWEELVPVKPMRCNITNFVLNHPIELEYESCIYFIDIKLLVTQYFYYAKNAIKNNEPYNEQSFVYQYPMTNMIKEFFNLGLINTYLTEVDTFEFSNHMFYVTDNSEHYLEDVKDFRISINKKRHVSYIDILRNIKLLDSTAIDYYKVKLPYFNSNNASPYFLIYFGLLNDITNIMNKSSLSYLRNDSLGYKLFYYYLKTMNIKRKDTVIFEVEKFKLIELAKSIKG